MFGTLLFNSLNCGELGAKIIPMLNFNVTGNEFSIMLIVYIYIVTLLIGDS